ncbi:MAG: hypothetical protein ACETWK_00930 [Candidatus Aminicenantaceae bacterium]
MKILSFITDHFVVDKIINYLKLAFTAKHLSDYEPHKNVLAIVMIKN